MGAAGGLLAAGLVIGYLRALHPTFGHVPVAARWVFMELGSMTSGASFSIVTAEARSAVPSLGYTGAYAFANVFLTVAGSVILLL